MLNMQDTEKWVIDAIEGDRSRGGSIVVLVSGSDDLQASGLRQPSAISEANVLANWEACPSPN